MSLKDGMAAINLEMPERVPRTEYSVDGHWELVKRVTGIDVRFDSPWEVRDRAAREFRRIWNYDFVWNVLVSSQYLAKKRTSMGHAVYASGGTDFDTHIDCPFKTPEEVLSFDPADCYGRIPHAEMKSQFEENYRAACASTPDAVNMTGIYVTGISGLIDIFGWDMLLTAAGTDGEAFGELMNRYAAWMQDFFDALADADVPVVMIHDDIVWTSGAFMNPAWYRKYLFPNYKKYFAPLHESGKKIMYTSDGNYTAFIDDIAGCGMDGFVMEPTTDMAYIAEKYGKTHSFIGNADTRILLSGTKDDIYNEVKRCMDIGKKCPGFMMAVGNHIPPNTPVENALWYNECYEKMSRR